MNKHNTFHSELQVSQLLMKKQIREKQIASCQKLKNYTTHMLGMILRRDE